MKKRTHKCSVKHCQIQTPKSRTYCTNYHNRLEVLLSLKAQQNTPAGKYLSQYILAGLLCNSSNRLQPNGKLRLPKRKERVHGENLVDLYKNFEPYMPIILAVLGVKVNGRKNVKLKDQIKRAKFLAEDVLRRKRKKLSLMDGHGRIIFLFMQEMMKLEGGEEFLKDLVIEWVDIDQDVNAWHQAMFDCKALVCVHDTIFKEPSADTYVYLNFCGMKGQWRNLKTYLTKVNTDNCMFSCSAARQAKRRIPAKMSKLGRVIQRVDTGRNDFVTYQLRRLNKN